MLKTTIAGSLPKPEWLAEPKKLWPAWRGAGAELERAKRDQAACDYSKERGSKVHPTFNLSVRLKLIRKVRFSSVLPDGKAGALILRTRLSVSSTLRSNWARPDFLRTRWERIVPSF